MEKETVETIMETPRCKKETVHTIFYGRGRGIHSTQPFTGFYLKDILTKRFYNHQEKSARGSGGIHSIDGYRSIYSFSEIMNRNDQAEVLLVPCKDEKDVGNSGYSLPAISFRQGSEGSYGDNG